MELKHGHKWGTGKLSIQFILNEVNVLNKWSSQIGFEIGLSKQRVNKYINDNFNITTFKGDSGILRTVTPKNHR